MSHTGPAHSSNGAGGAQSAADLQTARDGDQTSLDIDQTLSDADQTTSDTDQTTAGANRTDAVKDEALADADQRASDRDQEAADRDLDRAPDVGAARQHAHDVSAVEREASTTERAAISVLRVQTAGERLEAATKRDEASRLRDLAAQARDRAADARDRIAAKYEPTGPAAEARERAAADRRRATADRERAAADREQAAADRHQVHDALSQAHVDELTGTYRRGLGTLALQREINRARHSNGELVLAFVDVDGLKEVNDRDGHAAGDALLIEVAATLRSHLRSYDPIVRFGGDEFICAFSDFGLDGVRRRFDQVKADLQEAPSGSSISVGFAELQEGDTLDDLTARGDTALYEAKRQRRGAEASNGRGGSAGGAAGEPESRKRLRFLSRQHRRSPGRSSL